jgi:hypothetical protein
MSAKPGCHPSPEAEGPLPSSTHSPEGVDLTLIRWMLSLSYEQRLHVLQSNLRSLQRLRRATREE